MNNVYLLVIDNTDKKNHRLEEFKNFGRFRREYPSHNPGIIIHDNHLLMTLKSKYKDDLSILKLLRMIPTYKY